MILPSGGIAIFLNILKKALKENMEFIMQCKWRQWLYLDLSLLKWDVPIRVILFRDMIPYLVKIDAFRNVQHKCMSIMIFLIRNMSVDNVMKCVNLVITQFHAVSVGRIMNLIFWEIVILMNNHINCLCIMQSNVILP